MNNIKILLLDDDEALRFNLEMYLSDEGFSVECASSGESALDLLRHDIFDVAIVDIRLPGMNGEEFIKSAHSQNPKLKFIIHTGSTKYRLPADLTALGLDDSQVFNKPVNDLELLTEKIQALFNHE